MLGYGATDDGYHVTAPLPDGNGAAVTMKQALDDAGLEPEKIDYINAHGTGTELNDLAESAAIKSVFGEHAYKVLVSSTKSSLGHLLGASGAVELIVCAKVINESTIPPTINLENQDERCDLKMDYVPLKARQAKVSYAMSNSFGFGGHNASLVVGKF
jgi:3-oxoacyl-[acyl-carrier-protein] synthase II